jgi:hypothetical protein
MVIVTAIAENLANRVPAYWFIPTGFVVHNSALRSTCFGVSAGLTEIR